MDFIRCRALAFEHGASSACSRGAGPRRCGLGVLYFGPGSLVALLALGVFMVTSPIVRSTPKDLNFIALDST
jgi:hypothetical protein